MNMWKDASKSQHNEFKHSSETLSSKSNVKYPDDDDDDDDKNDDKTTMVFQYIPIYTLTACKSINSECGPRYRIGW
jgi:hypothetical protein